MRGFVTVVKKAKGGALYVDIPSEIIKKMNLKPFMCAKIKAHKKKIIISNFEKTVKIKVDLDKKTIDIAKRAMKEEGYGSLDETFCNIINWFITKKKAQIVYLYPEGHLEGGYVLIDDYEKSRKRDERI